MDPISSFLAGLGPWGVVAGVVLTIGGQFVRNWISSRNAAPAASPAVAPAVPAPGPVPSTPAPLAPATPSASPRPLRSLLLEILPHLLSRSNPAPAPVVAAPATSDPLEDHLISMLASAAGAALAKK